MNGSIREKVVVLYRVAVFVFASMASLFAGLILYSLDARINQAMTARLQPFQTKEEAVKYQMVSREFSDLALKRIEDRLVEVSRRQEVNEQNARVLVELKQDVAGLKTLADLLVSDVKSRKALP
jgi:C4-dicarboxylate-specific signal transduction histidine kinase